MPLQSVSIPISQLVLTSPNINAPILSPSYQSFYPPTNDSSQHLLILTNTTNIKMHLDRHLTINHLLLDMTLQMHLLILPPNDGVPELQPADSLRRSTGARRAVEVALRPVEHLGIILFFLFEGFSLRTLETQIIFF